MNKNYFRLRGVLKNLENKIEFIAGKEQDFYDFLAGIIKKDKIAIISHNDLDGIASTVLLHEILKSKNIKTNFIDFVDYEFNMFENISKKLKKKKINKLFILDISESSDYGNFLKLQKNFDSFLIDHHPSEKKSSNFLKSKTEHCVAWTIYNLGGKITDLSKWIPLICATMFSEFSYVNKNNFEFMKKNFPDLTRENIFDSEPAEFSKTICFGLVFFKGKEKKIFDLILKNKINKIEKYSKIVSQEIFNEMEKFKKNAEFYPEKNLYFYYDNPKFDICSYLGTILSLKEPDKIFIFVSGIKNNEDFVKISSRNQSGRINLNEIMKRSIEGLENATAGGHFMACGGKIMKEDIEKFKDNILSVIQNTKDFK